MPSAKFDPIQHVLSATRVKGYAAADMLTQSISLCAGLWYLPEDTIRRLEELRPVRQEDFERAVWDCLKEKDLFAWTAFRNISQVHLAEETFQYLFHYWAEFKNRKDRLARLTERLIDPHLVRMTRPGLSVPAWLERFAISLLPATDGVFYDGTAGAGGIALRMARCGRREGRSLQIITNEIDPLLFPLSVLRARTQDFEFRQINADCLDFQSGLPKADLSVMFPPLWGGRPVRISGSLSCGSDWSYAYHQINMLSERGVGVCRIPNGALFNARNRDFREYLLRLNVLDMVISLPKNSAPSSAMATSLVVFRKGRKENDAIWMLELPSPGLSGKKEDGRAALHPLSKDSFPPVQELSPSQLDSFNLSPRRYPVFLQREGRGRRPPLGINSGGGQTAIPLAEAAQIYRGINIAGLSRREEGTEVLRLSDVQNGRICRDGIVRYDLSARGRLEKYQIHTGDILISCKGKAIKLCMVSEDTQALLSLDFLGIRPDPAKVDPWYLFYFLRSPAGQLAIQQIQMGSSITMIRAADLERLSLHYIPLARQVQYAAELRSANALIEEQLAALEQSKQRAYSQFYQKIGLEEFL